MRDIYYILSLILPAQWPGKERLIQAASNEFNCSGVEEFNLVESEVDQLLGASALSGQSPSAKTIEEVEKYSALGTSQEIKFYFVGKEARKNVDKWAIYLQECALNDFKINEEKEQDWNQAWREHFSPIEVGDKLVIYPSWHQQRDTSKTSLSIYPGQGFGTGSHETTYLCLEILSQKLLNRTPPVLSCLDFGCGSGILGIAAAKLGLQQIDLYDIDEEALANSVQNIDLNFPPEHQIQIYHPHQKKLIKGPYQLIFANILLPALISEAHFLVPLLKAGGFLVLSGLLREQVSEILELYVNELGLEFLVKSEKGDWAALLLQRKVK